MAEKTLTYEQIERPYDPYLARSQSDASNGSVESMPVKSDGGMSDIWIKNFIKSEGWQPKKQGFYINGLTGYAEFTNVFISGDIQALTGTIGGFNITATQLYATSGANTTMLSSGPIAFAAGPTGIPATVINQDGSATFTSINITGGVLDGTTTIDGRDGAVLAAAIDASGHFADNAIDTASGQILGGFTFGSSGAIQIGTYQAGVTGDIRISPTGILGRDKNNNTTFSINATTGVAVVSGLVVGTNVGLGTAQDSAGVTTIIGNTVTTSYLNAKYITAGSVSANNVTAGTMTGSTIQTASSGSRIVMNSSNYMRFYDGSYLRMELDTTQMDFYGPTGSSSGYIAGNAGSTNTVAIVGTSLTYLGGPQIWMVPSTTAGVLCLGNFTVSNGSSITLGGIAKTAWPTGGGAQSPWTSDINAAYYKLYALGKFQLPVGTNLY